MKTIQDLVVGDAVWWADVNRKGLTEGVVSKVGSKLITVGRIVFRKDTGRANDAYGHQRLIPDLAYHMEKKETARILGLIGERVRYGRDGVSLNDAKAAADLLLVDWRLA
jgi:hypothetical protein